MQNLHNQTLVKLHEELLQALKSRDLDAVEGYSKAIQRLLSA